MKPTGFRTGLIAVLFSGALAACAVGPNFHPPAAPTAPLTAMPLPAATATAGGKAQQFAVGADISGDWWTLYHSPELNTLIDAALANNPTLASAQASLLEAEENSRAAEGVLLPALSGSLQDERTQISSAQLASQGGGTTASNAQTTQGVNGNGNNVIPPFTLYDASVSVSYSLDLWGGARRDLESLNAQAEYQRDELEADYLTLTANIVTAAITQASLQAQIDATNKVIADEQHALDILQNQVSLGGVARTQLLQEQSVLAASQATLPPLQLQLAQTRAQLADYVGVMPGNFHAADFTLGALHLPALIPVSLPSAIVAQRPDIVAAAAQLHEASANLGVADAQMLPQISLSADIGHESLTTGTLFTPQTLLWSLVAGATQPIFEGGELSAKRKAALYALQASGAQYQATVIAAFQNVADALTALQYDANTLNAAQAAEDAAAQSLSVTQNAYQLGAQPFTAVLSAQTTYQNAAISQVKANAARLTDTAALYQALGGGWWHRNDVSSPCCGIIP